MALNLILLCGVLGMSDINLSEIGSEDNSALHRSTRDLFENNTSFQEQYGCQPAGKFGCYKG